MDGTTTDHSDSDSGESWTLLEPSPAYGEDAPELRHNSSAYTHEQHTAETNIEKDEDTDGISIISDSDPESAPCEVTCDRCMSEENCPSEQHNPLYISANPFPSNNNNDNKSIKSEDYFLSDNSGKHKTYVHRRNKRISTLLNILMLGSVITAAGVAIGHMWGARNECPMHTTPSINKILSNLYKLQEENAFLRSKLKELTLAGHAQITQQRKSGTEKSTLKQPRCKKLYEEPLNNKNAERVMKCVDKESNKSEKNLENPIIQLQDEKDFLHDIDKLKGIYQQNKSWLDTEIAKRYRYEERLVKKSKGKDNTKSAKIMRITEEPNKYKDENLKKQIESETKIETLINTDTLILGPDKLSTEKKISYADSLKRDNQQNKRFKKAVSDDPNKENKNHVNKKQNKDNIMSYQNLISDDLKNNDDVAPKSKQERKKRDRQKLHKKQKRKNKYEQWEMKGGYMKDYDDFSISSSQENEYILKKPDKNFLSRDFEINNYIRQFTENDKNVESINIETVDDKTKPEKFSKKLEKGHRNKEKTDLNWYDKWSAVRADARKKLEHELFGETTPNNAGWYFRRMKKREQCRAQGDNSTFRKAAKLRMNFKMKH